MEEDYDFNAGDVINLINHFHVSQFETLCSPNKKEKNYEKRKRKEINGSK